MYTKEYILKTFDVTEKELANIERLALKGLKLRTIIFRVVSNRKLIRKPAFLMETSFYLEKYVFPPNKKVRIF